jgi:histidinol-phosphate phosphatase family protein
MNSYICKSDKINMKAVILAGGRGIRLGGLTQEVPKPMISIGDKPLLHHQVDLLVKYGLKDITILVNYLKDPIMNYFGDGHLFGAAISYYEETQPLGTTGGIKAIENKLTDDFMVLYGDVMVNMDLSRFISYHYSKKSQCTLVLHPNDHPFDSDLVEINEEGRIIAFHAKPHENSLWYHNMVNAGVYILSPSVLKFLEKDKKADFGRTVFPLMYHQISMFGYHTSEYLKDMGTPERLEMVRKDLQNGRIIQSNLENKQRAVFLDRDGVLNVERSYISKPEELELYEFTPSAVKKLNHKGYLSIVVTNQSAVARNLCTEEDVQTIHKKIETLLGNQGAWLDTVYYCPHHPDKGFPEENSKYKIDCDCRKPKTGMFRKAIEKFNINTDESFMIGDSERDIQAGKNIGAVTIGVRTGYGIRKTKTMPDYMFSDLSEAVDFIVNDPFKSLFVKIYDSLLSHAGSQPWVLLIGGNTRTGKSTLASYLRIAFTGKGHHVLHVALDNWILPEEARTDEMNVYDRFQLKTVENDIKNLISGHILKVTTYANHPERIPVPVSYDSVNASIIIIDGVVALSSEIIRRMAHFKIFTTLSPGPFRKRIGEYYKWRGKTEDEIEILVHKRKTGEYQLIEKESNLADMIINTSDI